MNGNHLMRAGSMILLIGALAAPVGAAPNFTQTFSLHPGWNAVYLEVEPPDPNPQAVFGSLPLLSVWTWNGKMSSADFIQEPSEAAFNRAGWLGYFPPGPFAALTNLFSIHPNRAYLVRIGGTTNATLTITGRPSVRDTAWTPNSLNLTGFHVDPAAPPTFGSFLASSSAHAGQAIYKLGLDGAWTPLPASTPIQSGEAYWVYCSGASTFTAPTWVDIDVGDALDYDQQLVERSVTIRNASAAASVTLRLLTSATPVPLTYWRLSPTTDLPEWPALPNPFTFPVAAQNTTSVRLAVKRASLGATSGEGVMEIKDGRGTRILIAVTAEKLVGVSSLSSRLSSTGEQQ